MINGINYPIKLILKEGKHKQKKITYVKVKPDNQLKFRVEGSDQTYIYDETKHSITVGGKKIVPLYSYSINSWNVLLPFIAYEENIEEIKAYLKSIASTMYSKEDDEKKNI